MLLPSSPPNRRPASPHPRDARRRQTVHAVIGVAFWVLWVALWVLLFVEGKVTVAGVEASATTVVSVAVGVLLVTTAWIHHNVLIYRRKGPRTEVIQARPATERDRLGRRVEWEVPGGPVSAERSPHLVVEVDGELKRYLEPPAP